MDIIDLLNHNSGFVMAVLTAVYVVTTFFTVRKMTKANELTQKIIELEKDKKRPNLVFTISPINSFLMQAEIKNIGDATAYNVNIESNQEIYNVGLGRKRKINFIDNGIPSLSPNAELSTILGSYEDLNKEYDSVRFTGHITYERLNRKSYKEDFDIDLSTYEGLELLREKGINDLAQSLDKIQKDLRSIASGSKNPKIRTIDEKSYQEKHKKAIERQRKKMQENNQRENDNSN